VSEMHDMINTAGDDDPGTGDPPLPWDHWSRERRQWTALGVAVGLLLLGAVVGLVSLWS
jgi:hypothetical protein